jgi:hypothetical protein
MGRDIPCREAARAFDGVAVMDWPQIWDAIHVLRGFLAALLAVFSLLLLFSRDGTMEGSIWMAVWAALVSP